MSLFTKRVTGLVSLFLIMVLLALTGCSNGQAVPRTRILAQDAAVRLKPDLEETPTKRPKERQELPSKRTRYSTRYVHPNGTFTEEIFMEPQFFKDPKDKQWKKIDNTLKLNKNRYENAANDMRIGLAETAGTDAVFQLAIGDKSVAFLPVGAVKIKGKVKDNTLTYKGLYPNVDASYLVTGNSVKENIVLQKAGAPGKFTYELATKGVMPFQEQDGTVSFLDEANNRALWYLPRPFMYDAAGKTSGNVTMKLRAEGERRFLDLTADPAFLNAATTKYPVTIDPSVNNWDVIRDTFVASGVPTASYASSGSLFVGANPTYGTTRSLLQFSLRSLPSDSVISAASLNLYNTTAGTADSIVDLYRVTGAMATSPTWSTQPTTAATAESSVTSNAANAYWTWYVTRLVKDWYNGIQANNGVQLRMRTETAAARTFTSVNSGTNTPRLTIDYTLDPIGFEDYWGYTRDSVNVANGNLVVKEADITTPGRGPEVGIARVHNSRAAGNAGMFGYGWFSNLESVVWEAGIGPATLLDEDRTRHVFGQNAYGEYEAAPDVKLQLVKNADGSYTVTKPDGTVVTHNAKGRIATISDTAGNVVRFNYDANNRLTSVADASGRLTTFAYGANGYVSSVTAPGDRVTTYAYDTAGNLTTVTEPGGTALTYTYDAQHRLTQTKMHNGVNNVTYDASNRCATISKPITVSGAVQNNTTTLAYDPANTTTTVTEPDGHQVQYIYNTIFNLTSTVDNPGQSNEAVTSYGYDAEKNLTFLQDPLGNQMGTPGNVIQYKNGNETAVQLAGGQTATVNYDANNNPIASTDFANNKNSLYYNGSDQTTDIADPLIQTTSTGYLSGGLLDYASRPISAAENYAPNSSFEIDQNGDGWVDNWSAQIEGGKTASILWANGGYYGKKAVTITNPTGWAVVNTATIPYAEGERYTISGFVKTTNTTGPAFVRMEFYDANTRWLGEQRSMPIRGTQDWTRLQALIVNPPAGTAKMRAAIGMLAGTGTAAFDAIQVERGHVASTYNLLENSGLERDADNNNIPDGWGTSDNLITGDGLVKSGDPAEVRVGTNSFRLNGERGKQKFLMQRLNISGDAGTPFTLSGWSRQAGADPNGGNYTLQIGLHPAAGGSMVWNNANNFSKINADWQFVAARVQPNVAFDYAEVFFQFYDQTGTAVFDGLRLQPGNSFTFFEYDPKGNYQTKQISPTGLTTTYTRDERGNVTSITDPMIRVSKFAYNARDQVTEITDPRGSVTSATYNPAGKLSSIIDPNKGTMTFAYNELYQLSSRTDQLNRTTRYDYNKSGDMTKQTNPNGSTVTKTVVEGNVTGVAHNGQAVHSITYNVNDAPVTSTDSTGRKTTYEYNANGVNTREVTGPVAIEYGLTPNNTLSSYTVTGAQTATVNFSVNPLEQIESISRNGVLHTNFVYNERRLLTTIQRANGLSTSHLYDDEQRLQYMREYNRDGDLLTAYELGYEEHGNVSKLTTHLGTTTYLYDPADQLTYELLPDGTTNRYTYDANGNRTQRTVTKGGVTTTTTYTYDAANQLKTVNGQAYTHDANGNLTAGGGKTYVYDAEDRLTTVKNASGATVASFGYDYNGLRTSMTTAGGTVYYHYNNARPQRLIAETDGNGNILTEYTWDPRGYPATMTRNGYTYYYHLNGHGDVILLTDSAGNSVAQYQYDIWGVPVSQSGALADANPFRYNGYQYDGATGLYYLFARYYDPSLARFLTKDPIIDKPDTPVQSNLYLYANNNPHLYSDDTGKMAYVKSQAIAAYNKLATYGNHCGPKRGKAGVDCKGHVDYCCYWHDRCYGDRTYFSCSCNMEMVRCIDRFMNRMGSKEKAYAKKARFLFRYGMGCVPFYRSSVKVTDDAKTKASCKR